MPYPEQMELMHDLVLNDHTQLEDTPLSLAIYFRSRRVPDEECVFEVLHRFGFDEVSEEHSVFQVQFGPTHNFRLPDGDRLRLFLSNPTEILYAVENNWPELNDLCGAMQLDQYKVIYHRPEDPDANKVLTALQGLANALALNDVAA